MNKKLDLSSLNVSRNDYERNIKVPKYLNNDLSYICGVLTGDGYISTEKDNKYKIYCSGNPSDEIEFYDEIITQLYRKLFNAKVEPKLMSGGTYGIKFSSKSVHSLLTNILEMHKGRKEELRIPPLIKKDIELRKHFIIGLFDTDFGFTLKRRYKNVFYYPVICFCSKSSNLTEEIYHELIKFGFSPTKFYMVKKNDDRTKKGYTITYRFDLNGHLNLMKWFRVFGTRHPKNIKKFNNWKEINKNNTRLNNKIKILEI